MLSPAIQPTHRTHYGVSYIYNIHISPYYSGHHHLSIGHRTLYFIHRRRRTFPFGRVPFPATSATPSPSSQTPCPPASPAPPHVCESGPALRRSTAAMCLRKKKEEEEGGGGGTPVTLVSTTQYNTNTIQYDTIQYTSQIHIILSLRSLLSLISLSLCCLCVPTTPAASSQIPW